MSLFVDTCVWSLALRRDRPPDVPEVAMERRRADISILERTGHLYFGPTPRGIWASEELGGP